MLEQDWAEWEKLIDWSTKPNPENWEPPVVENELAEEEFWRRVAAGQVSGKMVEPFKHKIKKYLTNAIKVVFS